MEFTLSPLVIIEKGDIMTVVDILDAAMYSGKELIVTTRRGKIIGIPVYLDDFISDSERLGYCLDIGGCECDTVFLDEIIEIKETESVSQVAV